MRKKIKIAILSMGTVFISIIMAIPTFSATKDVELTPSFYDFYEKNSHYEISDDSNLVEEDLEPTGQLILRGNLTADKEQNGVPSYKVNDGTVTFSYYSDTIVYTTDEEDDSYYEEGNSDEDDTVLFVIDDSSKEIDDFSIDSKIESGALVVQSSFDGNKWVTDEVKTDIFSDEIKFESFYKANDIQLVNGCYYRIILVYKMSVESNHRKVLFFNVRDHFDMKCAEVYKCHLHSDSGQGLLKPEEGKRIGELSKTELNKGYSGNIPIVKMDDPQYSKPIGDFYIGGFSREESETKNKEEIPVFLKDVDHRVTLWFKLNDDINKINGNSNMTIVEDNGGYDSNFRTGRKNFGRGALIIRYTGVDGRPDDTVVYTNFLAACDTTRANTMVNLFEEGDYEVALDYKIKNTPRKVGSLAIVPEYSDYRIFFKFEIRNGNCMVYPFDLKTGSELSEFDLATDGFRLDLAKSRYLNIDISRAAILENQDGSLKESTRTSVPTTDGAEYTDEGIYTFTVSNKYTNKSITKVIFVGESKYICALAKNYPHNIDYLNEQIKLGAIIDEDGTIKMPTSTEDEDDEQSPPNGEDITEPESTAPEDNSSETESELQSEHQEDSSESATLPEGSVGDESDKNTGVLPFALVGVLAAGGAGGYYFAQKKKKE